MNDTEYAGLAEVIRRAVDATALASTDFEQDHGWPWNRNTNIHYRQSAIRAALRRHPVLAVVEDRYADWGRIKVVDPEGGPPFLLKPRTSLLEPDSGIQQRLPGFPDGDPLLAYELKADFVIIYKGIYRQIERRNGSSDYQIVGELHVVWSSDAPASMVFDQEEDEDWTTHLDDHEGEARIVS